MPTQNDRPSPKSAKELAEAIFRKADREKAERKTLTTATPSR